MTRPLLIARRMFWRIYATVLASLVLSAILVATLWILFGPAPPEVWERVPNRLLAAVLPPGPPDTLQDEVSRLADAVDGDITVLGRDGHTLAFAGENLAHRRRRDPPPPPWAGPPPGGEVFAFRLADGRLVLARFGFDLRRPRWHVGAALLLVAITVGVVAVPVVSRLTRRLERLRNGVERWGEGDLGTRVPVQGSDEIAAVARSFNTAAERVQNLLAAHRALLANASHELRSPLTRLSVAASRLEAGPDPAAQAEIDRNVAELDSLIEEILLASRLDTIDASDTLRSEPIDLLALAAEEAARTGAGVEGEVVEIQGDARLLRRLLRNLLENAARHGAPPVEVSIARTDTGQAIITVSDRGPGIPPAERARIFEPFYRPPGRAESTGGWGLGLALVRQIAARHGGAATCEDNPGGGTSFVVTLPA